MGLGNIFGNLLVTSLYTWVRNGCIVERYIDIVTEKSFFCMISKFFIVIKFLFI